MLALDINPFDALTKHLKLANRPASTEIMSILGRFSSHGLNDLNKANLMERVETKFLLPIEELPDLLGKLTAHYSILEIDGHRVFSYENIYLDTPDFKFYSMHHNGQLHRYKVRHRTYKETGTGFLEIKFKNNKRRTDKKRIPMDSFSEENIANAETFLYQGLNGEYQNLEPKQSCSYRRIAFANEEKGERVTIDFSLTFSGYKSEKVAKINDYFIAEVKQMRCDKNSPFMQLMKSSAVRPTSFSKYCLGCCITAGSYIKQNRFKPRLKNLFN